MAANSAMRSTFAAGTFSSFCFNYVRFRLTSLFAFSSSFNPASPSSNHSLPPVHLADVRRSRDAVRAHALRPPLRRHRPLPFPFLQARSPLSQGKPVREQGGVAEGDVGSVPVL
jgi:hypothetical protein